ncbi:hypothetical protein A3D00_03355 [Candidatus Woesebacteria bacterium RIFCSPHIGHO2_02_FULL_38_9]|uniref:Uncharacterized protein n=1 Tax=Candidatus Woesebacteria bacterium RIFCSPHIGHO2_01_FULL_39_28 TaxID=1802496 RepID=A0A1F7YEZ4_9BACT|nr:MAG: hypothetical protein A2627_01560 [Candidatus Woesebacteria bacterium RIFCSPHIGHO2_01_FULL_39_28]OGM32272.1 MAG: hypothetical protein A3D00_03355 [Candidatus Woesebacteria bacterium RIFCSPHIGHO2_02_FULL_38_9]
MGERQCKYIKDNGEQCSATPMKDADYCFSHNPDTQVEKHLAVVKGGLNSKKVNLDLGPLSIKDPQEVATLLEDTINGVRSGEIPPNIANTIGYLAGHALKAIELAKYAGKIESVERVLMERKITK